MPPAAPFSDITHVIQLSIAPVFLLLAAGSFLGVLSSRLARIVDRSRIVASRLSSLSPPEQTKPREEIAVLMRRRTYVNYAITFGTCAALLVCLLIVTAFVGALLGTNVSVVIAALFVLAMLAFVVALLAFLREVLLASSSMNIGVL